MILSDGFALQQFKLNNLIYKWFVNFQQLKIQIIRHNKKEMEFDMIAADPSIANCFRRIMLAEVTIPPL